MWKGNQRWASSDSAWQAQPGQVGPAHGGLVGGLVSLVGSILCSVVGGIVEGVVGGLVRRFNGGVPAVLSTNPNCWLSLLVEVEPNESCRSCWRPWTPSCSSSLLVEDKPNKSCRSCRRPWTRTSAKLLEELPLYCPPPLVVGRRCSWRTNLIRIAGRIGHLGWEHRLSCRRSCCCIVHHPKLLVVAGGGRT